MTEITGIKNINSRLKGPKDGLYSGGQLSKPAPEADAAIEANATESETLQPAAHGKSTNVILIRERYFTMLKKDLLLRNPLRLIRDETGDLLSEGEFGAVLARAGVGKTALLVQLSLGSLLREKNVLHISLNDPVDKVSLWYKEVFNHIADQYNVGPINQLWNEILPHRFIMTFRVEGFSVPKLEERLTDLTEQQIFSPRMVIVDGLPFDEGVRDSLQELKALAKKHGVHIWFTIRTHRHEDPGPDGLPMQLSQVQDLFEVAIQLVPEGKDIFVKTLKGGSPDAQRPDLRLDPSTMLIKDGS